MRPPRPAGLYEAFSRVSELEGDAREASLRALEQEHPGLAAEVRALLLAEGRSERALAVFEAPPPPPGPAPLRPGDRVGRFEVVEPLGQGGMGRVYLARDPGLGRRVALKLLPSNRAADPRHRAQLRAEARLVAALDHPHIATVYEVGETPGGDLYVAMAYLEGPTLRARLRQGALPVREALTIARQVALALEAAHRDGVVHRDVKPDNIVLTHRGAQVIDFGIAGGADGAGAGWGTSAYLAPERVRGGPGDYRADQWGLGVVLSEMLTGAHPFRGESGAETLRRIVGGEATPVDRLRPDAPQACQRLVERMLASDPDDRFRQSAEVVRAIEAALALADPPSRPQDLPLAPTPFVGREQEVWQIRALLEGVRLLALTGVGGSGKTRLAVEAARRVLAAYPGGVFFVPLAPLSAPEQVPPAITQALGVREGSGIPLEETVRTALADREALLILDNFEHVLEAGGVVARLLAALPALKVLATSRAPLRLGGEREYTVPPMPPPPEAADPEHILRYEAVALFADRAEAAYPGFEVDARVAPAVAAICRRLDGLPLAIELAAARMKVLSPDEILARLDDRFGLLIGGTRDAPARHRTLREAIAWSYDLLSEPARRLFRRLAVCSGGCTLEAAGALWDGEGTAPLDAVTELVDHHLLVRTDPPAGGLRFSMLETIRAFALDDLRQRGEDSEARRVHFDHYAGLAREAAPHLRGPDQLAWLGHLDAERDNLRAALEAAPDPLRYAALADALAPFWLMRGYLAEGSAHLPRALAHPGLPADLRTRLLSWAGTFAHNRGAYRAARAHFEESLAGHRALGNAHGVAETLNHLGWAAWRLADYPAACALSTEALALHRDLGDDAGVAVSLNNLGWAAQYSGAVREAVRYLEEALGLRLRLGTQRGVAFARCNLGAALGAAGRWDEAEALLAEAVAAFREVGDRQLLAFSQTRLAAVYYAVGRGDRAAELLEGEALPAFRAIGDRWGIAFALGHLGTVLAEGDRPEAADDALHESLRLRRETEDAWGVADAHLRLANAAWRRGSASEAAAHYREGYRIVSETGDRAGLARCLEGIGQLLHGREAWAEAARALGGAEALRQETGAARSLADEAAYRRLCTDLERHLGGEGLPSGDGAHAEVLLALSEACPPEAPSLREPPETQPSPLPVPPSLNPPSPWASTSKPPASTTSPSA
jgi:predicted ATPase